MANQDLTFASASRPKDQVTKDRAYTFTFKAYDAGGQAVPSAATISIRKPGGVALPTPVVDAAMTINGSGDMSYALIAGNAAELGANYLADVAYTVSGTTYVARALFDVVRVPLRNVVVQADLVRHHKDLTDALFSGETTAQDYIAQAFEDLYQLIDAKGRRPWLVLSSDDLRRALEHRALELFFFARSKAREDRWFMLYEEHQKRFHTAVQVMNLVYDEDESGTADGTGSLTQSGEEATGKMGTRWKT